MLTIPLYVLCCGIQGYYKYRLDGKLFEVKDAVLYQYEEPRRWEVRQLCRRVLVPVSLRELVHATYHATPLAGNVGVYQAYFQIKGILAGYVQRFQTSGRS
jgi:hypothetical protein